jgi:hypothetical protein
VYELTCQPCILLLLLLQAPALCRRDHGDAAFRFCQQCGTLHPLDAFDGTKRSCRKSLARRRWSSFKLPTPEATSSEEAAAAAEVDSMQAGGRSIRRAVRRSVTTGSLAQRVAAAGYFQPQLQPLHLLEPELSLQWQQQQQQPDCHMDQRLQAMQARLQQLEQHLLETKRQAAAVAQLDALEQQCRQLGAEFEHHMRSMTLSGGVSSHSHMHPEFLPSGAGLAGPAHSMALPPLPPTPAISVQLLPPMAAVAGNSGGALPMNGAPLAPAASDPGTACIAGLLQQEWQGLVRDIELKASLQRTPDTAGSATATPSTAGSSALPHSGALLAPAAMSHFSWGVEHMHIGGGTAAAAGGMLGGGWQPQLLVPQQVPAHMPAFSAAASGMQAAPPAVSMPLPGAMAAGMDAAPAAHAANGLESFPWEEDVYYMQDACSL